jgi:hypothetical protein
MRTHPRVLKDFAALGVTMTQDELVAKLGDSYKIIEAAGFVLVPKAWRERALRAAENKGAFASPGTEA